MTRNPGSSSEVGDAGAHHARDSDQEVLSSHGHGNSVQSRAERTDPWFEESVDALNRYLRHPSDSALQEFQAAFERTESGGDWLMMLFEVFKESLRDVQENQKYFLKALEERNRINDAFQGYLDDLADAAQKLNERIRAAQDESKHLGTEDLSRMIQDIDRMSTRVRNEADKIEAFFNGWQERCSQVDQQLAAVLRAVKDILRAGVGGSDLGSS